MSGSPVSLASLLRSRSLVVLVGEGGVGKTSLSAAIAWRRATDGDDVAVLTIDPAPRLGDALGLEAIDAEPRTVALPPSAARGGSLTAMRLDCTSTFDRMVEQHAPTPEIARRLLAHPLYRAVSQQLGGTENYMAFQRLHELVEGGAHDSLVVDTPPAANAAELLSAPDRLAGLLDTGALSLLADPARIVARAGGLLARTALSLVVAALERVTGATLAKDVSEFAGLLQELAGGLERRARDIDARLRSRDTAFLLVTRPRPHDVADALAFLRGLAAMGIEVAAVVVNRRTPVPTVRSPRALDEASAAGPADGATEGMPAGQPLPAALLEVVRRMEDDMDALRRLEAAAVATLRRELSGPGDPPVVELASRELDVSSLDDVAALARALGD